MSSTSQKRKTAKDYKNEIAKLTERIAELELQNKELIEQAKKKTVNRSSTKKDKPPTADVLFQEEFVKAKDHFVDILGEKMYNHLLKIAKATKKDKELSDADIGSAAFDAYRNGAGGLLYGQKITAIESMGRTLEQKESTPEEKGEE